MFKFTDIQTGRLLTDVEVNEINFIIKSRAYRYIAAAGKKEWLFPEEKIGKQSVGPIGDGYLLMPIHGQSVSAARSLSDTRIADADVFDEYGDDLGKWI